MRNHKPYEKILLKYFEPHARMPIRMFVHGGEAQYRSEVERYYDMLIANGISAEMYLAEDNNEHSLAQNEQVLKELLQEEGILMLFIYDGSERRAQLLKTLFTAHYEARAVLMSTFSESLLRVAFKEEQSLLHKRGMRVLKMLKSAKQLMLSSRTGTDLRCAVPSIDMINVLTGDFNRGSVENLPTGEVYWYPNDSISGRMVVNGRVQNITHSIDINEEHKCVMTIANGEIVRVESNDELRAKEIERIIGADRWSARIGKISIGLNARTSEYGQYLVYDEKCEGVHLVAGTPCPGKGGGAYSSRERLWIQSDDLSCDIIGHDGSVKRILHEGRFV